MNIPERIGTKHELFSGKMGERELLVRPVTAEDVQAVLELQKYVIDCMPDKSLLAGTNAADITESAEKDFCMGIFDGDKIVAFAQMVVNRDSSRNLGRQLGHPAEKCVYFDIIFVHPDYRGLGLHAYTLRRRDAIARELGAELAFITVSPDNPHSLKNVMGNGFEVVDRREMYGGRDRYILMKKL